MGFTLSLNGHGLPAVRVRTPDRVWTAGEGEPAATLGGGSMEIFRALTGRRTVRQIGELSWSAPSDRWLPAFTWGPFTPPTHIVEEAAPSVRLRASTPVTDDRRHSGGRVATITGARGRVGASAPAQPAVSSRRRRSPAGRPDAARKTMGRAMAWKSTSGSRRRTVCSTMRSARRGNTNSDEA